MEDSFDPYRKWLGIPADNEDAGRRVKGEG